MASIHKDPASGNYRISFRYGPRQFQFSLKTDDESKALEEKGRIEGTLRAIHEGWLTIPDGIDRKAFWHFVRSQGASLGPGDLPKAFTLSELFQQYLEARPAGAMEENSLNTVKLHMKHLTDILGPGRSAQSLATADMQEYVNKRSRQRYRARRTKSRTIKKEIASFRAIWNWAVRHDKLTGAHPCSGLEYAKEDPKPPFMTWGQIEQKIARSASLTKQELKDLWDCLFLDTQQIAEMLSFVKESPRAAAYPFVYPMFVFLAHTSARRSELRRSEVDDFDFQQGTVQLREKKRDRTVKLTFRKLPMSPLLRSVMKDWFAIGHPGGRLTLCQEPDRKLTPKMAEEAFRETLADSNWRVLRGFHVLRHSFASNCAAKGVDPGTVDRWMGHQTKEMRDRYRHLFPKQEQEALLSVFG
jgi:integrase